MGRLQYRQFVS